MCGELRRGRVRGRRESKREGRRKRGEKVLPRNKERGKRKRMWRRQAVSSSKFGMASSASSSLSLSKNQSIIMSMMRRGVTASSSTQPLASVNMNTKGGDFEASMTLKRLSGFWKSAQNQRRFLEKVGEELGVKEVSSQ